MLCSGTFGTLNFGTANSVWSLGLRETAPGVWKVNRISPLYLPGHQNVLPTAYNRVGPEPALVSYPPRDYPAGGGARAGVWAWVVGRRRR